MSVFQAKQPQNEPPPQMGEEGAVHRDVGQDLGGRVQVHKLSDGVPHVTACLHYPVQKINFISRIIL
jgi:hypothetical protein